MKIKEENSNYELVTKDLQKQVYDLSHIKKEQIQQIESMQQSIEDLESKLSSIQDEFIQIKYKNKDISANINKFLEEHKTLVTYLHNAKKEETLSDVKIDSKLSLKGKFVNFDFQTSTIELQINNQSYFYPLSSYRCKYLPMFHARVMIFFDELKSQQIYGLDKGSIIEPAEVHEFIIKAIIPSKNQLKLYNREFSYINVEANKNFFVKNNLRASQRVLLKQIIIDEKYYFCMMGDASLHHDEQAILKHIKGI